MCIDILHTYIIKVSILPKNIKRDNHVQYLSSNKKNLEINLKRKYNHVIS